MRILAKLVFIGLFSFSCLVLHSPFEVKTVFQETNNLSRPISTQSSPSDNDFCCCKGRKCNCSSKQGGCKSVTLKTNSQSPNPGLTPYKAATSSRKTIASITGPACDSSRQIFAQLFKPFCIPQELIILNQRVSSKRNPPYFSSYVSIYTPPLEHPPKFS